MPVEDPLLVKFQTVAAEVAINNQLLLLIESDSEEALNASSTELLTALGAHPDIEYAISTPTREWFEENLAWVSNDSDLDDLLHIGNHITNAQKLESYKVRLAELEEKQEGFRVMGRFKTRSTRCRHQ